MGPTVVEAHCLDLDRIWRPADLALVTDADRTRASGFRAQIDARRFIAGRAATRRLLAGRLGHAPEDLLIAYGPFGRPYLPASALRFSVSHAGPLLLVTMAMGLELGCDIEEALPNRDLLSIAEAFFTPEESGRIAALSGEARAASFYDCWTCKEAYLKAVGVGASLPMDSFAFTPGAAGTGQLTKRGVDWCSTSWTPAPGYHAAVVAAGDRWVLSRLDMAAAGPPLQ